MATSSLFHNFVIEGEENVRRFVEAFESSLAAEEPPIPDYIRRIRDPEELKEIFAKQEQYLEARRQRMEAEKNAR